MYRSGDHYVVCDECGFEFLRSEVSYRWDGALVCKKDWEPRHPQEYVRGVRDRIKVKDARPEQADRFLSTGEVTQDSL